MKLALVQVEELLELRLKEAGLSKFVHRGHSQFLGMGVQEDGMEELFVELVLTDGTVLDEAEKIVRHFAEELKTKGIRLGTVVRALWEVVDVTHVGLSRTLDGSLRAAEEFRGILKSGNRECQVTVDVSDEAERLLRQKLGGSVDNVEIAQTVRSFLTLQLSSGGIDYWDPLLVSRLSLGGMEMSFLLGYGPAFEELRQAITDALDPPVLSSFLADLSRSGIRIRDFDAVLPNLSSFLGGPYPRGRGLSVSAGDLFANLRRTGQELLRQYFRSKVEDLENSLPQLKQEYPSVFS